MENYSRPLNNPRLVRIFLEKVLSYSDDPDEFLCAKISDGENNLPTYASYESTLFFDSHRVKKYAAEDDRWSLRTRIVNELFTMERVENDDDIDLGKGGALPLKGVSSERRATIIIGLPASGKSTIANRVADLTSSIILDSDYAKRKLPEYHLHDYGASLVHDESSLLIFGDSSVKHIPARFCPLQIKCAKDGLNVCIPKIGNNYENIIEIARAWKKQNYTIHLILVQLDRRQATIRAVERFQKTSRYIPLGLIFDVYANDPLITYYRIKDLNIEDPIFESLGEVSTSGPAPEVKGVVGNSPVLLLKQS